MAEEGTAGQHEPEMGNPELDVKQELERLRGQNEALLADAKKHRTRHDDLIKYKEQAQNLEKEKLQANDEWQKLAETSQAEALKAKQDLDALRDNLVFENAVNTLKVLAPELQDPYDALEKRRYAGMLEKNADGTAVTRESVEQVVKVLRDEKPYWFKAQNVPPMADGKPMTPTEGNYEVELKACKTQADLEAVMKKHGRI